jgi:glutaminyl-tRNA synthetase
LSKRKLLRLVKEGHVEGWDDPRMPTLSGIRRRGVPPAAIRNLIEKVGVAKRDSVVDYALFEHCIREILNKDAERRMAVLKPLKVVITNYPEGESEELEAINNPEDPGAGTRMVPFGRELFIERDDFMEDPPKKFFRLAPGREVRLRYAYFITCNEVIKDEKGEVVELRCSYDPATKGGDSPDGRKVKATLHWVSAADALTAEVRLYDHLFEVENPGAASDFVDDLNPGSLEILTGCKLEPSLAEYGHGEQVQFERLGYFAQDTTSKEGAMVFNRIVTLRDTWARIRKQQKQG